MEVQFKDNRVIFAPYSTENDIDPNTKKFGVRTHNIVFGFFLSLIGKAERFHDNAHNKNFYVDTNDAITWLKRHGIKKLSIVKGFGKNPDLKWSIDDAIKIAKCTAQIQAKPEDIDAWYQRGRLYFDHGNLMQAVSDLTEALKLNPNDQDKKSEYMQWMGDYLAVTQTYLVDGRALFAPYTVESDKDPITKKAGIRTHNKAIGFFLALIGKAQKLSDECKKNVYINIVSANKWIERHGLKKVNPKEAPFNLKRSIIDVAKIAKFTIQIQQNSSNAEVWYQRARLYFLNHNLKQAIEDFSEAIKLSQGCKENAKYMKWRARCYENDGGSQSLEKAAQDYLEMHKINSNLTDKMKSAHIQTPLHRRAIVYEKMGRIDLALQNYTEVLKDNPANHIVLVKRAKIYHKQGNLDASLEDYKNAMRLNSKNYFLRMDRGQVYIDKRMYKEAIYDFQAVQKRDRKNVECKALIKKAALLMMAQK